MSGKGGFKSFNKEARSIYKHYQTGLNFLNKRRINAAAGSFNAKIKAFRS
ncbi:MAG: hypothetical protein RIF36_02775 [Imperialibacter sp.]